MPGKASSGYTVYHKIGANYYAAYKTRTCKKFMHIKCKNYRQGCSWTGRIKNISGILDETDQQYWIYLPYHSAKSHTCNPLDFNKLCQNDFRNFVKEKYNEGFRKFSDIRRVSNLDVELAENYANLIEYIHGKIYTYIRKKFKGVVVRKDLLR